MAALRIGVLGPVAVHNGQQLLDVGSRRRREVLAALTVDAGAVVSSGELIERVWGGAGPRRGRAAQGATPTNLQAVVSRLRAHLRAATDEPVIQTVTPGYRLNTTACEIDALLFHDAVTCARRDFAAGDAHGARDAVRSALTMWRGRPYADVRAEFADTEATRLEELHLAAQDLLAEVEVTVGDVDAVLATVPRLLDRHPLRESLRATLMTALYQAGRQSEALEQYELGRRLLVEEMGIDPDPTLQALHSRILRQDPSLHPPSPPSVSRSGAVDHPPDPDPGPPDAAAGEAPQTNARADRSTHLGALVGRVAELAALTSDLSAGLGGPATTVIVAGEAGIGKTTLVEASVAAMTSADPSVVTAWGHAMQHEAAPALWVWEQVFTTLLADPALRAALDGVPPAALAGLSAVFPGLLSEPHQGTAGGVAPADKVRLLPAVVASLEAISAVRPLMLVVEDGQWADSDSRALLEHVAGTCRGRVALVVTVRDPAGPDAASKVLIGALLRHRRAAEHRVRGLDSDGVAQLVRQRVGLELPPAAVRELRAGTGGNPMFLRELTALLREERSRTGRADIPVPAGIKAVVESRLTHVHEGDRLLLAASATCGREVDAVLLAELLDQSVDAVVAALDRVTAHGFLTGEAPGPLRFSHALVMETLELTEVGPMRRAAWHARIAELLERRHGLAPSLVARIAHHHLAAGTLGDSERRVRAVLAAADEAERRLAVGEAERLVREALQQSGALRPGQAEPLRQELEMRLQNLLTRRLGYEHPSVGGDPSLTGGAASDPTRRLWMQFGQALVSADLTGAESAMDALGSAPPAEDASGWRELAHAQALGQLRFTEGRLAEAAAALEAGLRICGASATPPLDLFVQDPQSALLAWLSAARALQGLVEQSDADMAAARARARAIDHAYTTVYVDILEAWRSTWLGRPASALTVAQEAVAVAEQAGFERLSDFALGPLAAAAVREGDLVTARDASRRAYAAFVEPGPHMFATLIAGAHGEVAAAAGDAVGAREALDAAIAAARSTGEHFVLADLLRLRADAAAQEGLTAEARELRESARAVATGQGAQLLLVRIPQD